MSTITVDPNTLSMLRQVKVPTDILDDAGKVLGTFTPKGKSDEEIIKLFDLDKARERYEREKDQARPFREMIAKLEALAEAKD